LRNTEEAMDGVGTGMTTRGIWVVDRALRNANKVDGDVREGGRLFCSYGDGTGDCVEGGVVRLGVWNEDVDSRLGRQEPGLERG
jgi:hypothetical protein